MIDKVIEIPTGSNSSWQGVDESIKPTFDSQQARHKMEIDNNDCFEEFEDDSSSENGQINWHLWMLLDKLSSHRLWVQLDKQVAR